MSTSVPEAKRALRSRIMVGRAALDATALAEAVSYDVQRPRFGALLMSVFAGVAALLSCVGVFGVMAYTVSARTREFSTLRTSISWSSVTTYLFTPMTGWRPESMRAWVRAAASSMRSLGMP